MQVRSAGPEGSIRIGLDHEGLLALPSLLLLKQPPLQEWERGGGAGAGILRKTGMKMGRRQRED